MLKELKFYYDRLVKYLQMIALPANMQRKIIEYNVAESLKAEPSQMPRGNISFELMELYEDLLIDEYIEILFKSQIINADIKDKVSVLIDTIDKKHYAGDKSLDRYAQLDADESVWEDDAIEKHPFWEEQRKTAKKILDDLNEPLKVPDNLYGGLDD